MAKSRLELAVDRDRGAATLSRAGAFSCVDAQQPQEGAVVDDGLVEHLRSGGDMLADAESGRRSAHLSPLLRWQPLPQHRRPHRPPPRRRLARRCGRAVSLAGVRAALAASRAPLRAPARFVRVFFCPYLLRSSPFFSPFFFQSNYEGFC